MAWQPKGNIRGPTGPAGPQGLIGPPGATGQAEAWWSGAGVPPTATGAIGDWYVNTSNSDVYEKTGSSTWTLRLNIKGAQGATGSQGPQGNPGATGSQGPKGDTGAQGATGAQGPAGSLPTLRYYQNAAIGNPTGANNTSGEMMGFGRPAASFLLTPQITGRVFAMISGSISNNTANMGAFFYIVAGTGSAPANNGALPAGAITLCGAQSNLGVKAANVGSPFCCAGILVGNVGTQYWFDLLVAPYTAGLASVTGVSGAAFELP